MKGDGFVKDMLSQNHTETELCEVPTLCVTRVVEKSNTDGPGNHVSIYAQGFSTHFGRCHDQQTWAGEEGTVYTGDGLLELITTQFQMSKLVTFTGGEPFDQATGFGWLALKLSNMGYSIAVHTGYTFEELLEECRADNDAVARLLCMCDVLVDGPFDEAQKENSLRYRYSRNQRILDVPRCFERGPVIPFIKIDEGWG